MCGHRVRPRDRAGVTIAEEGARRDARRVLALTIGIETGLLIGFTAYLAHQTRGTTVQLASHWQLDGVVALAAFALGLQTGALRRVGGQPAATVYISGMLTRVAEESVRLVYWRRGSGTRQHRLSLVQRTDAAPCDAPGGIVVAYAAGALAGSWANDRWGPAALSAPIVLLAGVALLDAVIAPAHRAGSPRGQPTRLTRRSRSKSVAAKRPPRRINTSKATPHTRATCNVGRITLKAMSVVIATVGSVARIANWPALRGSLNAWRS